MLEAAQAVFSFAELNRSAPPGGAKARPRQRAAPDGGADAPGLSKVHNRTEDTCQPPPPPTLTWYPGASLVDINCPRERVPARERKQKKRGRITVWSESSRLNLKRFLSTLLREEMGRALIVTLTYPQDFPAPEDHEVYKYHLKKFCTYLLRRWPQASGIWKLEFQKRGAAHYHLMLFGLRDHFHEVRDWVTATWAGIAHKEDVHGGKYATKVELIKCVGGAAAYLVKYLSKEDQTLPGNFSGRYWGKINVPRLPEVNPRTLAIPPKLAVRLQRIARKKVQKDVEASRWKRWAERMKAANWKVTRLQWETAKMQHQGGAKQIGLWSKIPADKIHENGETWSTPAFLLHMRYERYHFRCILKDHAPPKRWKPLKNDRVRVMCDASAFVMSLTRGI
jgi:hypothetical protein